VTFYDFQYKCQDLLTDLFEVVITALETASGHVRGSDAAVARSEKS